MNVFKLAKKEHNTERLNNIVKACIKRIDNAATENECKDCLEHIGICQLLVNIDEYIYEYTPFKMFLLKLINKADKHKQFIEKVNNEFSLLRQLTSQRKQLIYANND